MILLTRTNSENKDFIGLVAQLDSYLAEKDGEEHSFYNQFNKIDRIKFVVVAYENNQPIGCGAIKEYDLDTMEIKRMYVHPESRGKGVASDILKALEDWAVELSFSKCILETGKRQPEAIQLYLKSDYKPIQKYGQYAGMENSLCFEKKLNQKT